MKNKKSIQLIVKGLASGILVISLTSAKDSTPKSDFLKRIEESDGNITERPLTEEELMLELNEEGARLYRSLNPEAKNLALHVASRSCNGRNQCAGLNACATTENTCAGQGSCAGKTKCAVSDKNLAVKLAAKRMAEKRSQAQIHR
jgi:hypothetical protein